MVALPLGPQQFDPAVLAAAVRPLEAVPAVPGILGALVLLPVWVPGCAFGLVEFRVVGLAVVSARRPAAD